MSLEAPTIQQDGLQKTHFNASMFLGYPSQMPSLNTPLDCLSIGPELRDYIFAHRPPRQYVDEFFNFADTWISFIPEKELRSGFSSEFNKLKGEEMLLLACIRLVTEPLPQGDPANKQYLAVKMTFLNTEIDGVLSVCLLQALLLILLYEYGHGIYPSAYMTLGACTRYLAALRIETGPCSVAPSDWIDIESRRRLWWSVYVMER